MLLPQKPTVTVVIPAKNEEQTIGEMVDAVRLYCDEILVVDGHSTDRTREIAASKGARVELDHGLGKGDAIRTAIQNVNTDIIVFIDADGSHDAADIPRLVAPIVSGNFDMVIGSRSLGGSDEAWGTLPDFMRNVGSHIILLAINYRFGTRLTDSQNGFRAFKTAAIKKLELKENITTIEQEMLIKCIKMGCRITEVPAHEYRRKFGESRFEVRRVAYRYVWSLIKYLI
jgi:dolichol-phosphate mannosyltransferase